MPFGAQVSLLLLPKTSAVTGVSFFSISWHMPSCVRMNAFRSVARSSVSVATPISRIICASSSSSSGLTSSTGMSNSLMDSAASDRRLGRMTRSGSAARHASRLKFFALPTFGREISSGADSA